MSLYHILLSVSSSSSLIFLDPVDWPSLYFLNQRRWTGGCLERLAPLWTLQNEATRYVMRIQKSFSDEKKIWGVDWGREVKGKRRLWIKRCFFIHKVESFYFERWSEKRGQRRTSEGEEGTWFTHLSEIGGLERRRRERKRHFSKFARTTC